jgi:hypothetical protein
MRCRWRATSARGGKVIAIEPHPVRMRGWRSTMRLRLRPGKLVQAAAASEDGEL